MLKIISHLLLSFIFLAFLAAFPLEYNAQDCKNEICVSTSSRWDPQRNATVRRLHVSGFPRTKQGYVTQFHHIRGLGYPHPEQVEIWPNKTSGGIEIQGSKSLSVQACRRTGTLIRRTYCTSWESFRIY